MPDQLGVYLRRTLSTVLGDKATLGISFSHILVKE